MLYLNTLNNEFVNYDDSNYIINNPRLRGESITDALLLFSPMPFLKGTLPKKINEYLPVRDLTYWLDYKLWGLNPFGYHLTNILLYTVLSVLVYLFFLKISSSSEISLITTIIFATHPLHIENVAWISERKDLLSAIFYLLSFIYYIDYLKEKRKLLSYLVCFLLFIAGWLSKPLVITLPFIMFLYGLLERRGIKKSIYETALFWIFDIMFLLLNTIIVKGLVPLLKGPSPGLISGINYTGYYIMLFLFPHNLTPVREPLRDFTIFSTLLSLISIVILLVISRERVSLFFFLFFTVNLLPVLNLTPLGNYSIHDRYMLIPSIGIAWIFSHFISQKCYRDSKKLFIIIIVSLFCIIGIKQNRVWQNSIELWTHTLRIYPDSSIAHLNLGSALKNENKIKDAETEYKKVIEMQNAIPEMRAYAFYNLGLIKLNSKQYDEAINLLELAINDFPEPWWIHRIIANIFVELKNPEKAKEHYKLSLQLNPDQPGKEGIEKIIQKLSGEGTPLP